MNLRFMNNINRIIYVFWTGNNQMSDNRKRCLDTIYQFSRCEVVLVTEENLSKYIKQDHPFHARFECLSFTQRSDYLRCYFMHHFGGGYSDIKCIYFDWNPYFDYIDENFVAVGYEEIEGGTSEAWPELWPKYKLLIGNCHYIMKPYSKLTSEWYFELHRFLDQYDELLTKYPSRRTLDWKGKDSDNFFLRLFHLDKSKYPFRHTQIGGDILHPLAYKYRDNILRIMPTVNNRNYE